MRAVLARDAGVDVEATLARLRRYAELLVQWNRGVSNLISKNDEERVIERHILPSIEHAVWLKSHNLARWCDLGSGGGLPAIPLVICGVGNEWDLVESRRTKTLFLQRAVGELGLEGVRVLAARIEDLVANLGAGDSEWGDEDLPALRSPYHGFTSRATLALAPTLECAAPIVGPDGRAFLWKGSKLESEAEETTAWRSRWERGEMRVLSVEHSVVAEFIRKES